MRSRQHGPEPEPHVPAARGPARTDGASTAGACEAAALATAGPPQGLSAPADLSPRQVAQRQRMVQLRGAEAAAPTASAAGTGAHERRGGLPAGLRAGLESLSGMSLGHVRVHYNSSRPAQLQAHAFAQGSAIHLAPGQAHHLPHEAWHVVQQAQGRVRPTLTLDGGVPINDSVQLEREADVMGAKATLQRQPSGTQPSRTASRQSIAQLKPVKLEEDGRVRWYDDLDLTRTLYDSEEAVRAAEPARIAARKLQFTQPTEKDEIDNAGRDAAEEREMVRVLGARLGVTDGSRNFTELQLEHATHTYDKGTLTSVPSMKGYKPERFSGVSHIEMMRKALVPHPLTEEEKAQARLPRPAVPKKEKQQQRVEREKREKLERHLTLERPKEEQMLELMPRLLALSRKVRLTHYYDGASEASILNSGRLQSKERRIRKAEDAAAEEAKRLGKDASEVKPEEIKNKSSSLDDQLGNTDHVFFFGEYEADSDNKSKFRVTRFGGEADVPDEVLHQKTALDGSERRVSFPLNAIAPAGVHGYLGDLNSKPNLNAVDNVFSSMPMYQAQIDKLNEAIEKSEDKTPAPGAHLLMDLLRQRFTKSNFPGDKNPEQMRKDLENLSLEELHQFLFRRHPNKQKGEEVNPQLLVPGSVPFRTPGVRFDRGDGK